LYVGGTATDGATFAVGGLTGNVYADGVFSFGDSSPDGNAYNTIGTGDKDEAAINNAEDLFISDSLEVDGAIYAPTIYQGANQVCDTSGNCTGTVGGSKWSLGSGAISPYVDTLDVLIGNSATTSAEFAFTNMAGGGSPTFVGGTNAVIDFDYFDVSNTGDITLTSSTSNADILTISPYDTTGTSYTGTLKP